MRPDLRDVGPLLLLDLSGALTGGIDMTGDGASHKTAITFTGRDIAGSGFAAGKAEGSVTIASLFDQPQPSGSATFGKLRIGIAAFRYGHHQGRTQWRRWLAHHRQRQGPRSLG